MSRIALVAAVAVVVGLLLPACTGRVEVTRVIRTGQPAPGEAGRSVLWITPRPHHPLGALQRSDTEAIEAIEALDGADGAAVASLRGFLGDRDRVRIRSAALDALGKAGHADAPLAILVAARDPHPTVRARARELLSELTVNTRDALFERAIRADDADVSRGAAATWPMLLDGAPPEGIPARLLSAVEEAGDPAAAGIVIANHCGRTVTSDLLDAAAGSEELAVRAAVEGCRLESGPAGAMEPVQLSAALGSESADVVRLAAGALQRSADRLAPAHRHSVLVALDSASRTFEPMVAIAVAGAQQALGDQAGVDALAVWVRSGAPDARVRALTTLGDLGHRRGGVSGPTLVGALASAFDDPDATLRGLAAEVAGFTADGRVAGPLAQALSDPVADVRVIAGWAIGAAGARASTTHLVEPCLEDTDDRVRDACFASLHRIVHGHEMPPRTAIRGWLNDPGDLAGRVFWGRDFERWRQWYQLER